MAGPAVAAAGKIVRVLDRSVSPAVQVTRRPYWALSSRGASRQPQGPKPGASGFSQRIPGYKPSDWDKRFLIWTGRFKKAEDIPETVSFEMVDTARNKMRVKISYLMIVLTILGCITMVISGKQAVGRHESLTTQNLEKKARWREEAAHSASAKP